MTRFFILLIAVLIFSFSDSGAQDLVYESGGELPPELSSFNVHFYDLNVTVDPADSTIGGSVETHVEIVQPTNRIVLALDPKLSVYRMMELKGNKRRDLRFERSGDHKNMVIYFPVTKQPGERAVIKIDYGGKPIEAANPPWDGGLVWAETPSGEPWVGVASQTIGSWVWWPNKDHPSDRPDSVAINLTMPDHLVVASNGRSRGTTERNDGFKTWHWFVSTPINNYNITFNAAPYETLRQIYTSITGDEMEIIFWVLPEFITEGRELFPQLVSQMEFLERTLGPYPFRADKYGVAHAPYLGMEHQTLIAYGAGFEDGVLFGEPSKFDDLHQHELAHEWWGNLVTVWDWRDFWIHEGFGTYMQALYAEQVSGKDDYQKMIDYFENRISSTQPVAPRQRMSTLEITRGGRGGDVYYKGALFLHTLRNFIGDQLFFESLRRFAYPDSDMEKVVDGSHMRFVTTDDYLSLVNQLTGDDLDWMFEVYLRHAPLPILVVEQTENTISLKWNTETGDFPMPVDVRIGDQIRKVIPGETSSRIEFDAGKAVEIDPKDKLMMAVERRVP